MTTNTSANKGATMDAENHFKNRAMEAENQQHGVSPKNHKSRGNFFTVICVCIGLMFAGCDGDDDDDNGNGLVSGWFDGKITAQVVNGNAYNNLFSSVEAFASPRSTMCDNFIYFIVKGVYSNGGFTINLPQTIDDKYLVRIDEAVFITDWNDDYFDGDDIKISNRNVKTLQIWNFEGYDSQGDWVDNFLYIKEGEFLWWTRAFFWYVDRDVTITGTADGYYEGDTWNVSLKKGWNIVYRINNDHQHEYTTKPVDGMKWYRLEDAPQQLCGLINLRKSKGLRRFLFCGLAVLG